MEEMLTVNLNSVAGRRTATVATVAQAVAELERTVACEGLGVSQCRRGFGDVRRGNRLVARISYNGRVWPSGAWQPGMEELTEAQVAAIDAGGAA